MHTPPHRFLIYKRQWKRIYERLTRTPREAAVAVALCTASEASTRSVQLHASHRTISERAPLRSHNTVHSVPIMKDRTRFNSHVLTSNVDFKDSSQDDQNGRAVLGPQGFETSEHWIFEFESRYVNGRTSSFLCAALSCVGTGIITDRSPIQTVNTDSIIRNLESR